MIKYFTPTQLSENIHETPEGFLVCKDVAIGRTGEQIYGAGETPLDTDDNGFTTITRDPEELFNPDTIASFEGKAFTIQHPEEFVAPDNWSQLAKGVLQNVRKSEIKSDNGDEYLIADVLVTDALAIQLVKSGIREVSCGYEAIYESTGKGKGRQTRIIGNHLALVKQGRAGPSYAIMDHKFEEKSYMSKLAEQMKSFFSKAVDEAVALEKKDAKEAKDADEMKKKDEDKKEKTADDEGDDKYNALLNMIKALEQKIDAMSGDKNATSVTTGTTATRAAGDDIDTPADTGVEARIKSIEMAVTKILTLLSDDTDSDSETSDSDSDEMNSKTGDTASRVEILAPGMQISKNVKEKALIAAYGTKDGKAVIESLIGGKALVFDSAERTENLFIAASEILKAKRGTGLEHSKSVRSFDSVDGNGGALTPEQINAKNAAYWARK